MCSVISKKQTKSSSVYKKTVTHNVMCRRQ
uniref:Uncharacterized protein n=1 Tax=Anguilla anguilla TaxID=7936 RepID=A0A0E9UIY4_ANGAN